MKKIDPKITAKLNDLNREISDEDMDNIVGGFSADELANMTDDELSQLIHDQIFKNYVYGYRCPSCMCGASGFSTMPSADTRCPKCGGPVEITKTPVL